MPDSPDREFAGQNPYASPADVAPTVSHRLGDGQRIRFSGVPSRVEVLTSLRGRFSWPVMAILGVGALVCLQLSPSAFLNPLQRTSQRYRPDAMGELLGVIGVGLVALAVWHIVGCCTSWLALRREARILRQTPALYDVSISGWLSEECIYIREDGAEAWLSWQGVGSYQAGERLVLIDWGTGAGGSTILTASMFHSTAEFRLARNAMSALSPEASGFRQLADLDEYFQPDCLHAGGAAQSEAAEMESIDARADHVSSDNGASPVIGTAESVMTKRSAWRSVVKQIPEMLLAGSISIHAYFGFLLLVAFALTRNQLFCCSVVAGAWAAIFLLAAILTIANVAWLVRDPGGRLISTRTEFLRDSVRVSTTTGHWRVAVSELSGRVMGEEKLVLKHRASGASSKFTRVAFASDHEWRDVVAFWNHR